MGFDGDGGFMCHLEYDHAGLTVYEFGADYWLGTQTDELGGAVVVYGLRGGWQVSRCFFRDVIGQPPPDTESQPSS